MKRSLALAALFCALGILSACAGAGAPPPPVPGGQITTLPLGYYVCELPGDAGGPAAKELPEYAFRIVNASNYKADEMRGSYLYTGDRVVMTGGKLKGLKFLVVSPRYLRQIDDQGNETGMRCVLTSKS